MIHGSRFPLTRYGLARLLVLLAWHALPRGAEWPRERLMMVNDSVRLRMKRIRDDYDA